MDNAVDNRLSSPVFEHGSTPLGSGDNAVDEEIGEVVDLPSVGDRDALAAAIPDAGDDTPLARDLADNARRRIQLTGRAFPKPAVPRVLTVANQKGGVGKTTTTVNVAAAMAQAGLQVLVIDLDPQGNASTALGIDHHAEVPSIYDVLVDGTPLLDVVQACTTVPGLFCAPATIDLAGAEIELVSLVARESRLQRAIQAATQVGHAYDYILIDCPPSLGLLTVNAMVAASEVFIPIQCEYYALEGLSQLLKNIELVARAPQPPAARLDHPADDVRRPDPSVRPGGRRGARALPGAGAAHHGPSVGPRVRGTELRRDRDDLRPGEQWGAGLSRGCR